MAEMGGDPGEGENPRVFSSSPPSLVLPTPPKADQPLAERGRKLIVYLNLLRSHFVLMKDTEIKRVNFITKQEIGRAHV